MKGVLIMKKTKTAIILALSILTLASCTNKETSESTESTTTTTTTVQTTTTATTPATTTEAASETTTQATTTTKEPYVIIDPDNLPDGTEKSGENEYVMTLQKITDNEYVTPDGYFKVFVSYELIDNTFCYHVIWKNISDKKLTLSDQSRASVKTNLTERDRADTLLDALCPLDPGEEAAFGTPRYLEEGYSTAEAEIAVNAYLEADDNGNKVYYVTDPAPLFKLNFTK
jgi:hypothetical protein